MHELSHTVDLLERYQTFESNHARDFQSILDLLAKVGQGIQIIHQDSNFSGGSVGYKRIDLSQQPWYNEFINYNEIAYEKNIPKPPDMAGARYVCESAALDFAATGGESSQVCAWSKSGRVDQEALRLTKQYEAWFKEMYQTFGAPKEGPAIYLEDQLPTYLKSLETGINSLTGEPLADKEIFELKSIVATAWTAAAVTPIAEVYGWYGLQKAYGKSNVDTKNDKTHTTKDPIRLVEHNGKKIIQNDDLFDSSRIDPQGRSNLERMKQGLAPIGYDGKPVNIHHIDQLDNGSLIEMEQTYHQKYTKNLHPKTGKQPSEINRSDFDKWRKGYWKNRKVG